MEVDRIDESRIKILGIFLQFFYLRNTKSNICTNNRKRNMVQRVASRTSFEPYRAPSLPLVHVTATSNHDSLIIVFAWVVFVIYLSNVLT